MSERQVLSAYKHLYNRGIVRRIGPVFSAQGVSVTTLLAVAAPPDKIASVRQYMTALNDVKRHWQRRHHYNLWFVITSESQQSLSTLLARLQSVIECEVISLPLLHDFQDSLGKNSRTSYFGEVSNVVSLHHQRQLRAQRDGLSQLECQVMHAVQTGIEICSRPYDILAQSLGLSSEEIVSIIQHLLSIGAIKRWEVVVRPMEFGYSAEATVVWDVPDADLTRVAIALLENVHVAHCHHRPRRKPKWPYNLFTLIYGESRDEIQRFAEEVKRSLNLTNLEFSVLSSKTLHQQGESRSPSKNAIETTRISGKHY